MSSTHWKFKFALFISLLTTSLTTYSQQYFEGEIQYKFELQKKDSSFDETRIFSYPATSTIGVCKKGDWIQKLDTGVIEFYYFNHTENKMYTKYIGVDTLFFDLGEKPSESQDSSIKTSIEYNTDTVLGYICNRFILQSTKLKLIFIYSPKLAIDPKWYESTKRNYYDIIYKNIKANFLVSIIETDRYISKMVAVSVKNRKVKETEFPDIKKFVVEAN